MATDTSVRIRCPGCGKTATLPYCGHDCWMGTCPQCRGQIEYVVTDNQTGQSSTTFTAKAGRRKDK